ncbi:MAG: hypothetical protein VB815_05180 [Dehalococcoidia bacterium]
MSCEFRSVTINNPSLCAYDIEAVSTSLVDRITGFTSGDRVCKYPIDGGTTLKVSAH